MPGVSAWLPFLTIWVAWAAVCALNTWLVLRRVRRRSRVPDRQDAGSPVLVVAALKGVPEGYANHLAGLLAQRYARYRVSFCLESRADPAFDFLVARLGIPDSGGARMMVSPAESAELRALAGPGLTSVELVVAGRAEDQGQKVHNLLASLAGMGSGDRVVAFVDADALPGPDWLARLVAPLDDDRVGIVTGYRWLMPERGDWPSCFASAINGSVATTLGPAWRNSAWAGSMAISRQAFERLGVRELWRGALNDDTLLSRAAQRAGLRIAFAEGLLLPTPVRFDWAGLLEFGRRQYLQVRVCRPEIWAAAVVITLGYLFAWVLSVWLYAATGSLVPLALLGCVTLLDRLRAGARERLVLALFGRTTSRGLRRVRLLDRWGTPLVSAVHAVIVMSALAGRTVTWAGIRYAIDGPRRTRVLSRQTAAAD